MSDYFIGEIRMFAFDWPPKTWALCDGSVLPINQNQALFALLDSQYGPVSSTSFSLPDLRGRVPLQMNPAAGYPPAQYGGSETVALTATTVPPHTHGFQVSTAAGTVANPQGAVLAQSPAGHPAFGAIQSSGATTLIPASVGSAGGGSPHSNMQPFAVMNFCVSLQGIYPPRQ